MAKDSIFELEEFKPYETQWNARLTELSRRRSYYDGSVYQTLRQKLGWWYPRLAQQIRPLYLPLSRAVDVDAGIIPGGWLLAEDTPDAQQQAKQVVFDWSKWQRDGVLYVHYGAQYGVTGLKITDLWDAKQVVIKPVKPTCFMLIPTSDYDPTPQMSIYIETQIDSDGSFEYAEVITSENVRTFKAGEPHGYDEREPEYKNELGFVPYVEELHKLTGDTWGEATYQMVIPMLDQVNTLATQLAQIISKHQEPQWTISGADAGDMVKSGDNIWFLPAGSDVKPVLAEVDIPGVLEFIREIRDNVHGGLPELAFDELRKKDQIATATLELQLMELVLKIKRSRPNYDNGLVEALRLAGQAGTTMGIGEIAVLDDEAMAMDSERAVLPLDPETAMRIEMQAIALERERAMDSGEGAL